MTIGPCGVINTGGIPGIPDIIPGMGMPGMAPGKGGIPGMPGIIPGMGMPPGPINGGGPKAMGCIGGPVGACGPASVADLPSLIPESEFKLPLLVLPAAGPRAESLDRQSPFITGGPSRVGGSAASDAGTEPPELAPAANA